MSLSVSFTSSLLVLLLLFWAPFAVVRAGPSGLTFSVNTPLTGDLGSNSTACSEKLQDFNCESCSANTYTCPTGLGGVRGRILALPYTLWGSFQNSNSRCPNPVTSSSCSFSGARARFESVCLGTQSCTYVASNNWFGNNPCSGTQKYAAAIFTCGQFQRSSIYSVFRASLSTPAYWSTGNRVWASSASGTPDSSLTSLVTWNDISTGFQQTYSQVWTFTNGKMYILLSDQSRVHEIDVPTSSRTLGTSTRTDINDGALPLISAAHITFGSDPNGLIVVASATGGVGVWQKTGSTWGKIAQYTIPNTCGGLCFRLQTGAVAVNNDFIFFGASLGRVIRINRNSPSNSLSDTEVITAAAGSVTSLAVGSVGSTQYLYVASSIGLIFQYNIYGNRINSLALLSNAALISSLSAGGVHVDPTTGAIFVTATDGTRAFVSRIRADNDIIEQIDSELLPEVNGFATTNARAIIVHPPTNNVFVGTDQPLGIAQSTMWTQPARIHRFVVANCTSYDCAACGVRDPNFCVYCASNDQCVLGSAIAANQCPVATSVSQCPTLTSISRTSGSSVGGTSVEFRGRNLYLAGSANDYICTFGNVNVTASAITGTGVVCSSPNAGSVPLDTPIPVFLSFRGRRVAKEGTIDFAYISCSALSCSTCFNSGDCAWCYSSSSCTGISECNSGLRSLTQCPSVNTVTPGAVSVRNTSPITVQLNDVPAGQLFRCDYGNGFFSFASPIGGNRLNCSLPSGMSPGIIAPQILIESPPGSLSFIPFSRSNAPTAVLDVYDCDSISACFTCVNNRPECGWCSQTPQTAGGCSYNNTVEFTSTGLCSVLSTASCPRINSVTPNNIHFIADNSTVVDVALIGLSQSTNLNTMNCTWSTSQGAVIQSNRVGAGSTLSLAKCQVPNVVLAVGTVSLEIFSGNTALTQAFAISVYDCTAGTSCFDCTAASRPKCQWCNSLLRCEAPAALPVGTNCASSGGCPTIAASPTSDAIQGGSVITITPTPFPTSTSASCRFQQGSIDISVGATVNGSSFVCVTPRIGQPLTLRLRFEVEGTLYAAPVDFEVYDCAFTPGAVPRTCSDCVSRPGCSWCGSSCSASSICPGPLPVCPRVTGVSPNVVDATLQSFVTLQSSVDPPAAFNYDCVFGTERTPGTVVAGGIRCLSPNLMTGTPEGIPINVQIGIRDITTGSWSTNVAADQQALNFFRCSSTANSCGSQCSSAYCGFCLDQGRCTGAESCRLNNPNAIWLNGTSLDSCPALESFSPSFMQVAIRNRTVIQERISFRLRSLTLPSPVNVTLSRRNIQLSDFTCVFGADVVPVDSYDQTTNTFSCTAPVLFNQGFYSVYIAYKGARLNPDDNRFQVQDCFRLPACSICLLQPNCGWCRGSVKCMTKAWCDAEPIKEWGPVCPSLTSVAPATGLIGGGYDVVINGGPFVESAELVAVLRLPNDNITLNITRNSESQLTIAMPPSPAEYAGEIKIAVLIGQVEYVPSTLSFTYLAPAGITQGVAPGAIAGIAVAAFVIIAILALALILMKTRKVGFFSEFKLTPPDYALVAFGSQLQAQYKMPKDNYEILAIKLLAKDHGFVFSVMGFTAATEQDPVARALTHFFEWHKKSVEYGVLFVSDEVKRNKSENTIFRNNSMASKWFKFYSKIVGVQYLFNELARFIYELNKISDIRSGSAADSGDTAAKRQLTSSKSLLSLEMEVDPNKFGDNAFTDSEANVYQLILACQKVFTAIRTSIKTIPVEFKIVFQGMREAIMNKFNSEDAILKAIGGFFYLRFVCPAITAPHAYGLLENPPNNIAQRQLVLIGKVIQNLANMTMPGAKEEFMQQLSDFFTRNIPKMKSFYTEILQENTEAQEETNVVETADVVRHNALAYLWSHIHTNEKKLRAQFKVEADDDDAREAELNAVMNELVESYPKGPKKLADGADKKGKDD